MQNFDNISSTKFLKYQHVQLHYGPTKSQDVPVSIRTQHKYFIILVLLNRHIYSEGTSIDPSFISSMISCGGRPSTVQPTLCAVPKISRTVPFNSRAIDLGLIVRAMDMMSSKVMLPLCLTEIRTFRPKFNSHNNCITYCFSPSFGLLVLPLKL